MGEQDMFLISDALGRVGRSDVTQAFLDTRTGSHEEGADLGRSGKKARKSATAAVQLQQLQVVYTEESFTRRRERQTGGFLSINQLETVYCATSKRGLLPGGLANRFQCSVSSTTNGRGLRVTCLSASPSSRASKAMFWVWWSCRYRWSPRSGTSRTAGVDTVAFPLWIGWATPKRNSSMQWARAENRRDTN